VVGGQPVTTLAVLDRHPHGSPQGLATPGSIALAEQAGVEFVQCFGQLRMFLRQSYQAFGVLLSSPGLERLARLGGLVGAAGQLEVAERVAEIHFIQVFLLFRHQAQAQRKPRPPQLQQAYSQGDGEQQAGQLPGP
jgi:hypothetical protein